MARNKKITAREASLMGHAMRRVRKEFEAIPVRIFVGGEEIRQATIKQIFELQKLQGNDKREVLVNIFGEPWRK